MNANRPPKRTSATALAFEIKEKSIARREKRLATELLNKEICRYMSEYKDVLFVNGDFNPQMYNILGKRRIEYMKSVFVNNN